MDCVFPPWSLLLSFHPNLRVSYIESSVLECVDRVVAAPLFPPIRIPLNFVPFAHVLVQIEIRLARVRWTSGK